MVEQILYWSKEKSIEWSPEKACVGGSISAILQRQKARLLGFL